MAALRAQLQQASAQNKRQLAATLRGVQLLRGADGPDPKLLSMSQLHMLGEVLSALFDRLHERDGEAGTREDMLCELLRAHGIPTALVTRQNAWFAAGNSQLVGHLVTWARTS